MRRFHNPRYAPESLERKLSPSGIAAIPVAAEVYVPSSQAVSSTPAVATLDSSPDDAGPLAFDLASRPSTPGSPEPTDPAIPAGGTDPNPGDGNGDPPMPTPSTPSGPNLPAAA